MTVVLFTVKFDAHADRIEHEISKRTKIVRINLDKPSSWSISFDGVHVALSNETYSIDDSEIKSVFLRRIPNLDAFVADIEEAARPYADYIGQQKYHLLADCLAVLDRKAKFVNPLCSSSFLGKPVQQHLATLHGLRTPRTYIGSNELQARAFISDLSRDGLRCITKPIANVVAMIDGQKTSRFTEILNDSDLTHLDTLKHCPTIFQEYIEKDYEIRGTYIGGKLLCAQILSQAGGEKTSIDWRQYNIPQTPHYNYTLPTDVERKICALHESMSLHYSSFDLIRDQKGEYVFLETNPYGQWLWIEDLTGLKITKSIADHLCS
jgi:hypothetical protein